MGKTADVVQVRASEVPDDSLAYLTPGKVYKVIPGSPFPEHGGDIVDDEGDTIYISFKSSSHLGGKGWVVL